jgi:hypothetical protein
MSKKSPLPDGNGVTEPDKRLSGSPGRLRVMKLVPEWRGNIGDNHIIIFKSAFHLSEKFKRCQVKRNIVVLICIENDPVVFLLCPF